MEKTRILIVEDEVFIAQEIEHRLQTLGYEALQITPRGDEAISLAHELVPDLILMDIQLQGEIDGIEAANQIRDLHVPIVYVTAFSDGMTLERAKLTEPCGFILKPFETRDLKTAIELGLYKHRMERERDRLATQLKNALANVKTLTGLLPICCYCKKIKDHAGYWNQVEAYIMQNSQASFTHGMCPQCFDRVKKELDLLADKNHAAPAPLPAAQTPP